MRVSSTFLNVLPVDLLVEGEYPPPYTAGGAVEREGTDAGGGPREDAYSLARGGR